MRKIAPFGTWKSPITTDLITSDSISLIELALDGQDIYWIESRPMEGGRYTIMHRDSYGIIAECTPPDYSARTTVHEYGGGAFTVADGVVYFVNYKDQQLYRQRNDELPEHLTCGEGYRYADLIVDKKRNRIICIREDHTGEGEAVNTIVGVNLDGGDNGEILVSGNNFYSSARLSPDGSKLAYLTWNHPNMPWDGCELWVEDLLPVKSNFQRESLPSLNRRLIAGSTRESIFQPEWSPDNILHFVAEDTGWWNLYRWKNVKVEAIYPMEAEFGEPQWVFGMYTYDFVSATKILCCYSQNGNWKLNWLNTRSKKLTPILPEYTEFSDIRAGKGFAVFMAGSPIKPIAITRLDTETGKTETIKQAFKVTVEPSYLSVLQSINFPTTAGKEAHANYYPPTNKDFSSPEGEFPPLIVISHGGPTSASGTSLRYNLQYWTSRGFAILDVNYGGSSGYGREYRQRLNGNWGVVDVDDCCNGALYLVKKGLADPDRLIIRGGSAGGYTTLACLTFRNNVFKAGASYYGLSELEIFVRETHKFESRYMFSLLGAYPENKNIYFERSPINFTKNLACPMILFQGDEDKIVPPSQSQIMFEAVRTKELPVAYLVFKGEQHGFRKAESIKRSLEAELYFYSKIFEFDPADPIQPIEIENL
jgi:dipeptidyl aminopeptidase/acylaminoacyl peptidase